MARSEGGGSTPWGALMAVAFAAAGVGFGAYVYFVPYQRLEVELKRRSSDRMSLKTAADTRLKEVDRLTRELAEIQSASNASLGESGRIRSELKLLKAQFEERLSGAGATIGIYDEKLIVSIPEEALFQGDDATFTAEAQDTMRAVGEILAGRAARVIISAPREGASVRPSDPSVGRVRGALKLLTKYGVLPDAMLAVVGGGPLAHDDSGATLDVEIEPRLGGAP